MPLLSNDSVASGRPRSWFSRGTQAIAAVVDEELGPEVPVARVDRVRVVGVELDQRVVVGEVHATHASITSRQ